MNLLESTVCLWFVDAGQRLCGQHGGVIHLLAVDCGIATVSCGLSGVGVNGIC